ncbi:MAG: hypothetical protein R3E98_19765 [Gemmatimonadota bacterium]
MGPDVPAVVRTAIHPLPLRGYAMRLITHSARATALFLGVASIAMRPPPGAAQQAVELGRRYEGGTALVSPATGLGFRVPPGFTGEVDPSSELFLLSDGVLTAAVWAYSQGTPETVADAVIGDLEELGLMLTPDQVESESGGIRASFHALSERGLERLHGRVAAGSTGGSYAFAVLGPRDRDAALVALVDAFARDVVWMAPITPAWMDRAAGLLLRAGSDTGTSVDQGDGTVGSFVRESTTELSLCGDRTYTWRSEGVTYFSSDAASASSEHSDAHEGTWTLVSDLLGKAWLHLQPWDRDARVYAVQVRGDGALLDGRDYTVSEAGC